MSPDTSSTLIRSTPCSDACCGKGTGEAAPPRREAAPAGTARICYRIDAMDCPTEETLIRRRLEGMTGIVRLDFNLLERELTVHHRLEDVLPIREALIQVGMKPVPMAGEARTEPAPVLGWTQGLLLAISGIAAAGAEGVAWRTGQDRAWPVLALAAASILTGGCPTLRKGWIALRNWTINIHYLMSLAVIAALVIGKWPEAAMVIFLFAVAEAIEGLSLSRARSAIKALTALAPEIAEMQVGTDWVECPVAEVAVGSRIRVRTGARVPLDAKVLSGRASLDQAPVTGESLPVDKETGDLLFAGSIVTDGVVEAEVTAAAGDSTLARIAAAIQEAQSQRAPTQRFVDRFARTYTPAVVGLAVLTATLGPLSTGGPWSEWIYRATVLLVIACPCALVLSTPVTVVSGLAAAARHGILVKGGAFLEEGRRLRVMALDKTGTLTQGRPSLAEVTALDGLTDNEALRLAASLDDPSTHPVAKALVQGWRESAPEEALLPVEDFTVLAGRGVRGVIQGRTWTLGNHRLVEEQGLCTPALETRLAALEGAGKTVVVLGSAEGPAALFAVSDAVRPESREAVAALKAARVRPVMLTGDNPITAMGIAHVLDIEDARGNLMPEDKQAAVVQLRAAHGPIGMVGDGVNDAPALARADIGFAMGAAGTATALETADVAIMDDDPRKIADFLRLSHHVGRVLVQNIGLALGIKTVFLILAFGGKATLWMAVFADMGGSLLVVFNGLRLLRFFPMGNSLARKHQERAT